MMDYITHHRFKELSLSGKMTLPYGTKLTEKNGLLTTIDGKPVCYVRSENSKMHFARNDDGRGLDRGALTYEIAYKRRDAGNGYRFTDMQRDLLETEYKKFLIPNLSVILFNDEFFNADVDELKQMKKALRKAGGKNVRHYS